MLIRIVSLVIVALWATMTVLHVKSVYFPSESDLGSIPAEVLFQRFLELEDKVYNLEVFSQGAKVGDTTITVGDLDVGGEGVREMAFKGRADLPVPGFTTLQEVSLSADLELRGVQEVLRSQLTLRLPAANLQLKASGEIGSDGLPLPPVYRLTQGENVLLDSDQPGGGIPPQFAWVAPMLMSELESRRASRSQPESAGMGMVDGLRSRPILMEVAGRQRSVHVVEPDLAGSAPPPFQVLFLEDGDLISIRVQGGIEFKSLLLTLGHWNEKDE